MVRGGSHVALGLVAGIMGMDLYAMVGEDRGPLVVLGTSEYHAELHRFLLLPASWWVCLGSGRVQIGLRSVADQCESSATGLAHLVVLTLPHWMTEKGKVLTAPWVVLLRRDPALCRQLPAVGHMWYPRGGPPGLLQV